MEDDSKKDKVCVIVMCCGKLGWRVQRADVF